MTKKDYVVIADMIASMRSASTIQNAMLDRLVEKLADLTAADNERFDRYRFLAACGEEGTL